MERKQPDKALGGEEEPLNEQIRETAIQLENTERMLDRVPESDRGARRYVLQMKSDLERALERLARRMSGGPSDGSPGDEAFRDTEAGLCVYEIDSEGAILRCGASWDRFAEENEGPAGLRAEAIRGRRLWEFISDPIAQSLYRRVVNVARGGLTVSFPLRCDAPSMRRRYKMSVGPGSAAGASVRFLLELSSVEPRSPCPPASANRERHGVMLASCSWCNGVRVGDEWLEIEDAAEPLGVVGSREGHWVSHTTCDPCRWRVTEALIHAR